jgi:hypothetical protein
MVSILLLGNFAFTQNLLTGRVVDSRQKPVFAANVYWNKHPQLGAVTDFEGQFRIALPQNPAADQLIVSFIGYQIRTMNWLQLKGKEELVIVLQEDATQLGEVKVCAKDPISQKFSVVRMEKMDVYLNPVSNGDPLKAITFLPSSTNTDEMANPSIRGSSSDKSRVMLNGVPVLNPVRNSQINGMGNFSLFNTEIIHKQYVYASNPPLSYGNTSAGLVEIETVRELERSMYQFSSSLANLGFFLSQRIKEESFLQVYGNRQFDNAFLKLNESNLEDLKEFGSIDGGINFRTQLGDKVSFNSFNYLIDENYEAVDYLYGWTGISKADNRRLISISNLLVTTPQGLFRLNVGLDGARNSYRMGNLSSRGRNEKVYASAQYKWQGKGKNQLQIGVSEEYNRYRFRDSIPLYYFAVSPEAPNTYRDTLLTNHNLEGYAYWSYKLSKRWLFSTGVRLNAPIQGQDFYSSSQFSLRYQPGKGQTILLSGGKYHNYSTPNYYQKDFVLNKSYQLALDYDWETRKSSYHAAFYYKKEEGDWKDADFFNFQDVKVLGLELSADLFFGRYFRFSFSNTFLHQRMKNGTQWYDGDQDLDYFAKVSLAFNHPEWVNLGVTWVGRPGLHYTSVRESWYDRNANAWQPVYSDQVNGERYNDYQNLSLNASRMIQVGKLAVIVFGSVNNILNRNNQSSLEYSSDYSDLTFRHYQKRIYYFGVIWQLNGN